MSLTTSEPRPVEIMEKQRPAMTDAEWKTRVDLAALYRLVALQGWDDLIFTHISARIPGPGHRFLMNPLGSLFDEITASSLVEVDLEGNITGPSSAKVNAAGFTIHSALHAARDDAQFVIHLHTVDGMAVAAQPEGLLPLNQSSLVVMPNLAYHDYEGVALDLDERESLVRDMGDRKTMILRHHGTLATGVTAADAWFNIYMLERACSVQVRALGYGPDRVAAASMAAQEKVANQMRKADATSSFYSLFWDAMLRRLLKDSPGFDT